MVIPIKRMGLRGENGGSACSVDLLDRAAWCGAGVAATDDFGELIDIVDRVEHSERDPDAVAFRGDADLVLGEVLAPFRGRQVEDVDVGCSELPFTRTHEADL